MNSFISIVINTLFRIFSKMLNFYKYIGEGYKIIYMGGDEMIEKLQTRMRYDKLFSFMIGSKEAESIKVLMEHDYNVSAILRKSLNDIAVQIEKKHKEE
jgi:thiamine monophosphate kinase